MNNVGMSDMAYIVSRTLENKIALAENNDQNTMLVTLDVLKEILALLKEQETSNLYKCPNCGTWVSAENVVRCKECKYDDDGECIIKAGWFPVNPNWFCADGERKEGR